VPGIFIVTGVLALGAIVLLQRAVPRPPAPVARSESADNGGAC